MELKVIFVVDGRLIVKIRSYSIETSINYKILK